MSQHRSSSRLSLPHASRGSASPGGVRRRLSQQLLLSLLLSLLVLAGTLSNWSVLVTPAYAAASSPVRSTPPSLTFQKYLKEGPRVTQPPKGPPSPYPQPPQHTKPGKPLTPPPSAEPATMKPLDQVLSSAFLTGGAGVQPLDLRGSDRRLELVLQPGSLDLSHASIAGGKAPQGTLTLQLRQVYGHFEGMLNLLGYYSAQIVDSKGNVVNGIALSTPVTLLYHYQPVELQALNLNPASLLLSWPTLLAAARKAHQPTADLSVAMHNDTHAHALSAQSVVLGPGPFSLGGDPQNQMAPIPHLAEVQGNNGQLSYSYPLQVVPGAGGFTPQLALNYSSLGPNDRHNPTSPADDAGDGWSLTLGSITADVYPSGTTWYSINGIDNVGDRLLLYDNTNKLYYTEHLSYLRIQQITSSQTHQPCFNVWDKAGTFYEVGCTPDAWSIPSITASTLSLSATAGTIDFSYLAPFSQAPWATGYTYDPNGNDPCSNPHPPVPPQERCDDPVPYLGSNPFNPPQ